MDIVVRYWSERRNEVVDSFLTSQSVGHEDAKKVVQVIVESLQEDSLNPVKLLMLSRDSPNVMKKASSLLKEHVEGLGCPLLLEGPCYLHPVHTAFKEALKTLETEIDQLLLNVYGWFKLSTGRRDDMKEVFEEMEEKMEFFLRYVSTRWLTMGPCLVRLVEHWESVKKFFLTTLPTPPVSQATKKAMKTDRYMSILDMVKPANEKTNLARIKFLIFLAKINEPFLVSLQSEKPMIHKLYTRSVELITALMNLVVKKEKLPEDGRKLAEVKMDDVANLLKAKDCNFGEAVKKELTNVKSEKLAALTAELKSAVIVEIKYLQTHLPLKDKLLARLKYLDPRLRKEQVLPSQLTSAARSLERFDDEELASLSVQLNIYQVLSDDEIPEFDDKQDRIDHFWRETFIVIEEKLGEKPEALIKFVKIGCALSHGNGFVERSFTETKRIGTGRESLSVQSTNSQKTILGEVKKVQGTQNVSVGNKLINRTRMARMEKQRDDENKVREREDLKRKREEDAVIAEKRRKVEDWDEKRRRLESSIKEAKASHKEQDRLLDDALDKAGNAKKDVDRKAAIVCSKLFRQNMLELNQKMWDIENCLKKHLNRKPVV